jgi:hypothetical protein
LRHCCGSFSPQSAKNRTIEQGNSPDCTQCPQRMSVMTAYAQNQTPKAPNTPQVLRDIAEKSTAQARDNLNEMRAAAGEVATSFKGVEDYSKKVLEFTNVNINAAFEHASKLSSVMSPVEFFTLSNDYLRQQFEAFSRQAQELAGIAQKMAAATTDSIKAGVHKMV